MQTEIDLEALRIYVGDHIAGARGGVEIAERCADGSDGDLEAFLRGFLDQLDEERGVLRDTLERLGLSAPVTRQVAAKAGALAGLVREILPGRYDPVDRLEDLEALCVGVWGKRLLWSTLIRAARVDARLDVESYEELADRAELQERDLLIWRDRAVSEALGVGAVVDRPAG